MRAPTHPISPPPLRPTSNGVRALSVFAESSRPPPVWTGSQEPGSLTPEPHGWFGVAMSSAQIARSRLAPGDGGWGVCADAGAASG